MNIQLNKSQLDYSNVMKACKYTNLNLYNETYMIDNDLILKLLDQFAVISYNNTCCSVFKFTQQAMALTDGLQEDSCHDAPICARRAAPNHVHISQY